MKIRSKYERKLTKWVNQTGDVWCRNSYGKIAKELKIRVQDVERYLPRVVARKLGCSEQEVRERREAAGHKFKEPISKEIESKIVELYLRRKSVSDIVAALGLSETRVREKIKEYNKNRYGIPAETPTVDAEVQSPAGDAPDSTLEVDASRSDENLILPRKYNPRGYNRQLVEAWVDKDETGNRWLTESYGSIARELNMDRGTLHPMFLCVMAAKLGCTKEEIRNRKKQASKHPYRNSTPPEIVARVVELRGQGLLQRQIVAKLPVSSSTVERILRKAKKDANESRPAAPTVDADPKLPAADSPDPTPQVDAIQATENLDKDTIDTIVRLWDKDGHTVLNIAVDLKLEIATVRKVLQDAGHGVTSDYD